MGKLIITERENRIGVNILNGPNLSFDKGSLTASAGTTQGTVNLYDDVRGVHIARNHPFASFVDSSDTALGADASATVTALNNIVNASPETFIKNTDKITDLTGVTASDFQNKPGYGVFVGNTDGSLTTTPKIIFDGSNFDVDGSLYFVGDKTIGSTGTVGTITIDPATGINFFGSTNGYNFPTADGTNGQVLQTNGSGTLSFATVSGSGSSPWTTSGSDIYYTTGNVGIGTSSPGVALDIAGQINAVSSTFPVLGFTRETTFTSGAFTGTTGIASAMELTTKTSGDMGDGFGGGIVFTLNDATETSTSNYVARIYARRDGADNTGALQFFTGASGSDPSMIIRGSGNVGIGTTAPSQPLHVDGNIKATGVLIYGSSGLHRVALATNNGVYIGQSTSANFANGGAVIGNNAGRFNSGIGNAAIGNNAGYRGSGNDQVAIGDTANSGASSYSKTNTVGVGRSSNYNGSTGTTSVGANTGTNSPSSYTNSSFFGYQAGHSGGNNSVFVGYEAGKSDGVQLVSNTVAVGYQALTALTTGAGNTAVGYQASDAMTVSAYTTALGYQALSAVNDTTTNADGSTAVGYLALSSLTDATGNTAVGYRAGVSVTGVYNTIVGHSVGQNLTTGTKNVIIGHNGAGNGIVSGTHNTVIGYQAKSGGSNSIEGLTAVGSGAGNSGNTQSTHIGYQAGLNNSGTHTTNLGAYAGAYGNKNSSVAIGTGANSNAGGSQSVAIGRNAIAGTDTVTIGYDAGSNSTDSVFIGYQAGNQETNNNRLYIENSNSTTPLIYGEFDNDILRVNGTLQVNDPSSTGYAFPTSAGTSGQVLKVNAVGDLAFTSDSNTNISNTNLALDGNRTLDQDGSNLTIDPSAGIFQVNDSSGAPTVPEIQVGQGQLDLMGLRFPNADGSANQVIKTNGSGVLSFVDQTSLANTDITLDNNRTIDGDGNDFTIDPNSGEFSINDSAGPPSLAEFTVSQGYVDLRGNAVRIHGLTYPSSDGTNGQVLTTNGSGTLSFTTVSGGSSQWTTVNTNEIYYNSGNVGIGNTDPNATLDVDGDVDVELDSTASETFTVHDGTHDLFQVDTGTTGTIFSVNDVSGLPKLTVDDSDGVTIDKFKEVKYEKPPNADFSYQGDVVYFGATTGMTQGDLYYYNSSGSWAQADADAASSSGGVLLAIALGTASDTNGMLLKGTFTMAAGAIDGTEATGDELYVSTTAGHITSDVSSYTTSDVVRVVGYMLDGTNGQIWFNPSNDFIELA